MGKYYGKYLNTVFNIWGKTALFVLSMRYGFQ